MQNFFQILKKENENEAHLYIYGDIVTDAWSEAETSGQSLVEQLMALDVPTIHVHIDSYGGAVSEGWAIYNALIAHPAKIITHADGFVASAALYPFLAGDERLASNVSGFFFHQVMTGAFGYADDLRKAADDADVMTGIGIKAFTERTSMTEQQVRDLMQAESWVTPEDAMEYGLVTSIIKSEPGEGHNQSAKQAIFAQLARKTEAQHEPEPEPVLEETKPTMMQLMAAALKGAN